MNTTLLISIFTKNGDQINMPLKELLLRNDKTLLYFYPKDNTPGCTKEAEDFTRLQSEFLKQGIQIVGISRDTLDSHKKFTVSCALGIDLISDQSEELHAAFSVIGEKNNYGKITIGVIRSTFLLDSTGNILNEWRNVKATGHAEKILREITK